MNRANRPRLSRVSGSSYDSRVFSRAGDGSTLSLDFTTGVLDSRVTFSRAGGGSYVGNDGYLYGFDESTTSNTIASSGSKTFTLTGSANFNRRYNVGDTVWASNGANNMRGTVTAYDSSTQSLTFTVTGNTGSGTFTSWIIGNAGPRFDYDPTTTTPKGLLIEGSAINYALYSNALYGPGWNQGGSPTIDPDLGAVAPNGFSTTNRYVFPPVASGNVTRIYRQTAYPAASYPYTVSVWMKSNTSQNYNISILGNTTTNNTVTPVWQRFQVTVTSAAPLYGYIYISNESLTATTDISMWGVQLEAGSSATSYIPTGASTGSRAADDCLLDNISTAFGFNQSEGTILIKYGNRGSTGSMRSYTFLPASGAANQMFESSGVALNVYSSSSFTAQIGSTNASAARICAAYKVDDFAVSVNGGAVSTDTSGAVASSLTRVSIGGSIVNSAAYNFGPISFFKYWPTRLPNATLQSLTT